MEDQQIKKQNLPMDVEEPSTSHPTTQTPVGTSEGENPSDINQQETTETEPQDNKPQELIQGMEQGLGNLDLNQKRLSGSQRRKLAIQAAIARGEPIKPRKPRSNRKPRRQLEAGKPPVHAESAKQRRAETSAGDGKDPGKRERSSEASTPSPIKNPKRSRQEDTQATASSSKGSYKEMVASIKMAVSLDNYPEGRMTEDQCKKLQLAITREIWKCPPGKGPQFTSSYPQGGILIVKCNNEDAKNWLLQVVPGLSPWEGAVLRVGHAGDIIKTAKVLVWVPKDIVETTKPREILSLLETQNMELKTADWRIINCKSEPLGITIVLGLDENTLKELEKRGYKAFLGLSQLTFRVIQKSGTHNAAGTSS